MGLSITVNSAIYDDKQVTDQSPSSALNLAVSQGNHGMRSRNKLMKTWQEDQIQALLSTNDEHKLFQGLVALAHYIGFDFGAYDLCMPLPVSNPKSAMFSNYPEAWENIYMQKNYLAVDPTVRHGMHSLLPILWSDDTFASTRELWEEAQSFGLRVGWAQSSRDANGTIGILTLARSDDALSAGELRDKGFKMTWLTQAAHLGMSRCLTAKLMPEVEVTLSNRETEVLRWTAEGKTSSEVSEILRISERTVNFHINNAVTKLNTANKTAAAVKAAMLGILY